MRSRLNRREEIFPGTRQEPVDDALVRACTAPQPILAAIETFDLEFLAYTARFPRDARKRTDAKLANFTGTRIHLRSPAEVRRFLASFDPHG